MLAWYSKYQSSEIYYLLCVNKFLPAVRESCELFSQDKVRGTSEDVLIFLSIKLQ